MVVTTFAGDVWSKLEFDLSEFHNLFHMFQETEQEAIGKRISPANRKIGKKAKWAKTSPAWEDEEHGKLAYSWLMIPYVDALDQESLRERLEAGKRLLASVERRVAARELTPELLHEWGLLNRWAGALQLVYFSEGSAGRKRTALAGGNAVSEASEAHKRWYAYYFLRIYKRAQWKQTERAIERLINAIVDGKIPMPVGYDVKWFEAILQVDKPKSPDYLRVKPAFRRREFSTPTMKTLVAAGIEGIPPVDLEIPDP